MIFKIKGKAGGIYIADQKAHVAASPRGVGGWAGWGGGGCSVPQHFFPSDDNKTSVKKRSPCKRFHPGVRSAARTMWRIEIAINWYRKACEIYAH
jgi:hypothetical protein